MLKPQGYNATHDLKNDAHEPRPSIQQDNESHLRRKEVLLAGIGILVTLIGVGVGYLISTNQTEFESDQRTIEMGLSLASYWDDAFSLRLRQSLSSFQMLSDSIASRNPLVEFYFVRAVAGYERGVPNDSAHRKLIELLTSDRSLRTILTNAMRFVSPADYRERGDGRSADQMARDYLAVTGPTLVDCLNTLETVASLRLFGDMFKSCV